MQSFLLSNLWLLNEFRDWTNYQKHRLLLIKWYHHFLDSIHTRQHVLVSLNIHFHELTLSFVWVYCILKPSPFFWVTPYHYRLVRLKVNMVCWKNGFTPLILKPCKYLVSIVQIICRARIHCLPNCKHWESCCLKHLLEQWNYQLHCIFWKLSLKYKLDGLTFVIFVWFEKWITLFL